MTGEAARVADPDEAVSLDELALAARNHGMPLEALRSRWTSCAPDRVSRRR
jgi:hypothetical protein